MLATVLVCTVVFAAPPAPQGTSGDDLAAYDKARAAVGRDADAHVKLALWCEAHGLHAERVKHLALAVLINPAQATARGLLGLVAYRGQWQRPGAVAEKVKADEALAAALAEYNARRARTLNHADAQWKLALWCDEKGLDAEAQAHYATVVRLDPAREAAWKRLGCKKVNGRWVTEAQLAAEKAEAEAQKQANKHWHPLLEKWRGWLGDKQKRAEAERLLAEVNDPRAVPAVWATFASGDAGQQAVAVQVLGQIDAAGASRALAMLSIFGGSAEVRRKATETLKGRDPREFANLLIALLRKPIKYEVRPVGGPGSPGALFVEGRQVNVQRMYAPPPIPPAALSLLNASVPNPYDGSPVFIGNQSTETTQTLKTHVLSFQQFASFNPTDPSLASAVAAYRANAPALWQQFFRGAPHNRALLQNNRGAELSHLGVQVTEYGKFTTPYQTQTVVPIGQIISEYQKSALMAQQQLASDVTMLDAYNQSVRESNERVTQVLGDITGQKLGDNLEAWNKWWINQLGYAYTPSPDSPRPTVVENVPLAYTPSPAPTITTTTRGPTVAHVTGYNVSPYSNMPSCFGAGTLVRTLDGSCPIEKVRVGDRVLTQDIRTGALGYHPVTVIHHNPPSPTFLVQVGGDTIVSSPFHRFWIVGRGWVMARDLKGGENLRLLDGPAKITSVESGPVQPVFNLDVAEDHDFFAGAAAALVHDNTLPDLRQPPFDAEPSLAAIAPYAK